MKKILLLLVMVWLFLLPAGLRAQSSSCPAPTNITVSNITETTADVSWDKPGGGEWSHVTYSRHADLSSGNSLYPTGTSSVQLTGLSAGTTYYFRIEYECPGYIHSPWSDIISFTTAGLLPCPIPTNITASNVSSTSAVLSWSQPGSANEWQMAFRPSYENSPSTWLCQDTTYSFTGLSPNTTYCVMLTARCGGNGGSPWSNEVCFTTTSGGNNVSLVEVGQFDQSVPELPIIIQCNYSLSEQIYTAAEIGRSGEIHSIGFFNISDTITRNIDIYLVHTNKNSFSSGSDWTAVTATDRVFSGNVTFNKNDWTLIEFNTPFAYNGTDNLMLVVDDNTGDFNAYNYYFKSYYTQNQAIYSYNDYYPGTDIDPATNISGNLLSTKNYILLGFGIKQCQTPQNLTVSCNNQQHDATLTWDCNATDFYVEYKKTTDATWQNLTTTSHSVTLNSLPVGDYNIRVKAICNPGGYESDWGITSFTIFDIQSTANWYMHVYSSANHSEWSNKYVTFSMQDPSTGATASANRPYLYPAITYAYGYVWSANYNSNQHNHDLRRAPLNDSTRTIGAFETVKNVLDNNYVESMSFNPADGRIYYITSGQIVKSFHPSTPDVTTVVCDVNGISIRDIAFNSQGEAFFIEEDYNSKLYHLDLTNASYTLIGNLPDADYLAFDLTTDELFCATHNPSAGYQLWLVDPSTAVMHDLGFLGGDTNIVVNGLFMVGGPTDACSKPTDLHVVSTNQNNVTLTWKSIAPSFNIEYKKTTDTQWQQTSTSSDTITLNGLDYGKYEFRVQAVCYPGVSESDWATTNFSLVEIHSTANWYAYIQSSMDHPEWEEKFISFSMQNLFTADTASKNLYNYPIAITYANGYVWACFYGNTSDIHLLRAPLHNDTKTIGNFVTVKENFENDYIYSMAFNPVDGRIYYLRGDQKLLSFDPANPNTVTEIGEYTNDFQKIAINSLGEAFCIDGATGNLHRVSLTNADTTLVGEIPGVSTIAFDQNTDELFSTIYVGGGEMLYLIDPATAQMQEIAFIGRDTTTTFHTMFMVGSTANVCYEPENLKFTSVGMHNATVSWDMDNNADSWIIEYATASDFSNATTITDTTNSYSLTGLTAGTVYYVRVKTDCGANGESDWTTDSFHTGICSVADQCNITYELGDSYGDGWSGCAINVVDEASGLVISTLTMEYGPTSISGTLPVCNGRDIRFEWVSGFYPEETSYTVFTALGDTLFSGSNSLTTPVLYSVNCPVLPSQISIGSCTAGNENLPSDSYYNYGLSQQIYTAAEIGRAGNISSVSFYNNGITQTRDYDLYLVHTNKTSFNSDNDWVPVTSANLVFSGNVEMRYNEWTSIELEVPFTYDGTSNLLLVMDDNTGNWTTNSMSCNTFTTTDPQALYINYDFPDFDPTTPDLYNGTTLSEKNCIQLNFGSSCPKPKNLTVSTINNEVTLTWTSNATDFNVEYKKTTDAQWQQTNATSNTITLSGLDNTTYQVRVQAVCDPGVSESDWIETSFKLIYRQSTANWYAYVQMSANHPEWDGKFISFSMQNLNMVDTASETTYDYPLAITYANGYVWACFYDYNGSFINLRRAPLHNDTQTIGNYVTMKENFETDHIFSMAYNPVDSRIYYLRSDQKLLSFDPSNPDIVTEIGNYTENFDNIAINGSGEAFCLVTYPGALYRINLTDASSTLVKDTMNIASIAFDQNTNELFGIAYTNIGEQEVILLDTATADMQELGFIGGDATAMFHTMFMVGSTANICYSPENLTISSIGMHGATLQWDADSNASSWVVEYATAPDFSGATSVNVSTNSCQLSGLNSETLYYVRVKVVCSSNSESNWTKGSFHTEICPAADQCAITYELGDNASDGWNGCAINVVDVTTGIIIGTLTMNDGDSLSGVLPLCDGRDIRFEWVNGYYADETSYTIFSVLGDTLFSGSDTLSAPIFYTVNCPTNPDIVEIGSCTLDGEYLPSHSESKYSLTQQIYTVSEINRTGTISGISFFNVGTTQTRDYDMYLVYTSKTEFDHNLDWVPVTPDKIVFSGPIELTTGTWTEIVLDAPFAYNGTDNLLLVINDKTDSIAPGMSCHTFSTTETQTIYAYRDNADYNPMYNYLGNNLNEKNCIRLDFGTNCTRPSNLTVAENGMNQAKVIWDNNSNVNSWIVEYSTAADFSGAITTTVTTDSCLLTGLTPETEYHLRVKADCGADGESYWNVISFTTNSCLLEDQCKISYELEDSYGDGWSGNAINVVDVTSGIVLDTWTINYGSTATGSLSVCDGREIRFEWVLDLDENETSYSVYDANGIQIFSGTGPFLTPITYTVNCASSPCPTPDNLTVSNFNGGTAIVNWTENGSATEWQLCLDGDEANPINVTENPYTLSGLDTTIFHNVKVRANCGSDYSFWSTSTAFAKVRSTSNWYAYAHRCPNNTNLQNKFICFSAQDPATVTAASDQNPNALAATFVNGEVWFFDENNTNLYKAPLYNFNKTMGTCDTVATNFDGNSNIASMSYNPVDGRIYYILYTSNMTVKLKSFDPSNINDVTEIGTFNTYAWSIAIDSNGNAYCTDLMTGNLCQLNLTNATTTPVGNLGFTSTMPYIAFDMITGEMLMGQMESSNDNGLYLVNPATAERQLIGYINGGTGANISGLFMANGSAPIVTCPTPTNLAVSNITDDAATLAWTENGSTTEWQICVNGNETNPVNVTTNPYTLNGLGAQVPYTVKVRANCGANGYSQWSDEVSFTTEAPYIPPYFYITGEDSICPNQTTTLYVNTNMGTDYLWNTGETSQSITVPVGTYSVSVSKNGNVVAYGSFEVKGKQTYNITLNDTICESELPYTWNNLVFNAAGSQSLNLQAANGCDSVVTMILTVNPTYNVSDAKTICQSELPYSWNNITFNTAGTKEVTLQAANGCDSVVTMILTVSNIYQTTDEKTVCQSALPYVWNGVTFNTAGTKEVTLQAANGCDSVVTMTLTVSNIYQTTDEKTVCQSALPYVWNGVTFNTAGTKEVTLQAANGCDSVVTMTLTVSNIYQTTDEKTVCQSALPYVWNGVTFNTAGTKEVTLQAANGCDSVVTMTLTVSNIYQTTDEKTICQNALPYEWNGVTFNTAGMKEVTLQAVNGCDSVVTMTLTVNQIYQVTDTKTICESELPYTWNNVVFNAAGTQNVTLQAVNGCDSVVTMILTVNPIYQVTDTKTICESELPYTWNNVVFNAAGTQNVTLQAVNGCDSVVAMTLTVNPIYQVTDTKTICESELPYTWNNVVFNAAGTQNATLQAVNGCDSVVAMTLTVNPIYQVTDTKTICESELPYTWNNVVFNAAGTQNVTLQTVNGCDSVVAMTLTVNPIYQVTDTKTICESELPYTWNNVVFNAAGTQNVTLQTVNGCDSVVAMTLTVNPIYQVTDTKIICESELPYTWNNVVFNTAGTQNVTLQTVNGCDSVVAMTLTVNPIYQVTDTKTICESELPYTWNNVVFNTAGTQNVTLQTVNGCDSVVAMTLTVNPIYQVTDTKTICESELPYTWNNVVFNTAGTQNVTLQTVNGCDSVVAMTLTVNPIYQVTDTKTICESELPYTWNNVVFNAAGTQNVTLQAGNGCDSVVTMTLTVNQIYQVTDTKTICESELPYTWNNVVFNAAGTQNVTLQAANGCDSVVAMTLTVNPTYQVTDSKTVCQSELPYTWNNVVFNTAGTQNVTLQAVNGCDSVVAMTLIVNPTYNVSDIKNVCPSELPYTWNGITFNAAGAQTVTLQTVNGCDSVVTMILAVNQTSITNESRTICESELPYEWNGIIFNSFGANTATLQDENGCDSTIIMTLNVIPSYRITDTRTICQSELPYTWNNIVFNAADTQSVTLQATNGCDSVVTMILVVNPTYNIIETKSVCPSEMPYVWNGVTFSNAGVQVVTLTTANGCDSVVTMMLTVNQTHVTNESRTICQNELPYEWNGVTFDAAGVNTTTLPDANGCDSTVIMTLHVNPAYNINESMTICESELPYTWNGVVFDAAGTHSLNLETVNGCDSIITMTLTVNPTYTVSDAQTICESELPYTWNGVVFDAAGTQNVTLPTVNGCDSVVTMTLTVNMPVSTDLQVTACESYEWNEDIYTESGDYTQTYTAANGCDSVVTLHLTINNSVSTEFSIETSENCYTWNEETYCQSGDYVQTFSAANGCDSVVTLHLTISVGINSYNLNISMTVYPNPTSDVINVEFGMGNEQWQPDVLQLFDASGKIVNSLKLSNTYDGSTQTTQIDLSNLSNGIYFLKATKEGQTIAIRKIVKN